MEINMIPPVGPFKVERDKDSEAKRKKYFHIKGKIETVKREDGKYVIVVTSEEPPFKVEGILGEESSPFQLIGLPVKTLLLRY